MQTKVVVLVWDHRPHLHTPQCIWKVVHLYLNDLMGVWERSLPAVLQSSWRKVICASKQREGGWGGQFISRLMQCVCVCVCVCAWERETEMGHVVVCTSEADCYGYGWEPFLHSRLHSKLFFPSTPHSERIVERLPRRADLSLPVRTYLSLSLFHCLALKGGCFNLRYTN